MKICTQQCISLHSKSLLGGNLVDGVPQAQHKEDVWEPHQGFGPAPIGNSDLQKFKIEIESELTLPEHSIGILDRIVMLLRS